MITAIEAQPLADAAKGERQLSGRIGTVLDVQIQLLRARMDDTVGQVAAALPARHVRLLHDEYQRWLPRPGGS